MSRVWNTAGDSTHTRPDRWDSSWPAFVPEPQRGAVLGYFERRFGIPLAVFAAYQLVEERNAYRLIADSPHLAWLASLKVQTVGLLILRKIRNHLKPTTAALQRFGHHATQHRIELSGERLTALLQQGELAVQLDCHPGYVVLVCGPHVVGCGLYTPGRLRSQIPRRTVASQQGGREC